MKSFKQYINESILDDEDELTYYQYYMKDLKDLILEAKLQSSSDPWVVLQNAFAQCVTHYDGHGSAGKSGLDGNQLDKVIESVKKYVEGFNLVLRDE